LKLDKLVKVAETLKGEGFAGYENDQDPETHVKLQSADHARTGSAQQEQYDGTEGKSESKEKPLKVLTDGELEEVEKLKALALETKDALRAVELTKMRSDKWDDDERDEYRKYREEKDRRRARRDPNDRKAAKPPKDFDEDQRGDDDHTEYDDEHNEYRDYAGNFDREAWEKDGKRMQTEHQENSRDKKRTDSFRAHSINMDEKFGEELGEVPRSRVQGEKHGRKTVSDQGKRIGLKMVENEVKENPDVDADDLKDRAATIAHALTYTDENAEKWKAFRKATDVIKRRRRGLPSRRKGRKFTLGIEKDAVSNDNVQEMLARPKKPKRFEGGLSKEPSDSQQQAEDARRYSEDGGREGRKPFKSTKWRDYSPKTGREGGRTDHFGVEGLKQPTGRGEKVHTHEGKERGGKSKKIGRYEVGDITTNPYNRRYVSSERQPTGRKRSRANERDRKANQAKIDAKARLSIKALSKKLTEELKEGTNAANGTSPRGGNFMGTNDTEAFNVRHNGGRKTNRYGKRAEDLGNFP